MSALAGAGLLWLALAQSEPAFERPAAPVESPRYGVRGGLRWGLTRAPRPVDGPRGLLRLWSPVLADGGYDLLNFIAVEPIVGGVRCYSELEPSALDGVRGKRLWVLGEPGGALVTGTDGVARLSVSVGVERFVNGAHLRLTVTQRADRPDQIALTVDAEPDSAPLEACILTATMGNKARLRRLHLADGVARSTLLWPDYRAADFTPHALFGLARLVATPEGGRLVAADSDEADPAATEPAAAPHWCYRGRPMTQYWYKPPGTWRDELAVAVNGRFTYWMSRDAIPGGVAFENFELRERFRPGLQTVFGITARRPDELATSDLAGIQ